MTDTTDTTDTNNVTDPATALMLAKIQYIQQVSNIQVNNARWRTRRQMAWLAFILIIAFTSVALWVIPPSTLNQLGTIISWFFIAMTSIIAAYLGADAFTYVASLKSGSLPVISSDIVATDYAAPAVVMKSSKPITTPFDHLDKSVASLKNDN